MKRITNILLIYLLLLGLPSLAQSPAVQSVLINLGTSSCGDNSNVTFASIGSPNSSSYLISNCNLTSIFSDVFNKFIAYNPKDNKIYINDISHGDSRVYVYDMGLPNNYSCPASMPQTPTYQYSYVPNNWEFDINGNVWCIRSLSGNSAIIERINETTGSAISTKTLDFPQGHVPNTLGSGDIVILPNGRLFIAMGDSPTRFYEVTNYSSGSGNATANYIQDMPKPCYGILYLNGKIELTGTDLSSSCYKYIYDIPSKVMSSESPFQLGMSPIDNSSVSPAVGLTKQLLGSTVIDATTAIITYQVYAKNMGNVKLTNFNVVDDLTAVYGSGNVSNVSVTVDANANPDNLVLNPSFNGVTNDSIFTSNQVLSNFTNGYVSFTLSLKASNLISNKTYNNTARALGQIGQNSAKVSVVDLSNNGSSSAIDPNNDGDPGDKGENTPTPYFFGIVLPIQFVNVEARHSTDDINAINWTIGITGTPISKFEVEYSEDNRNWKVAGIVLAENNKTSYHISHTLSASTIFYRVRAYENTGQTFLSKEVFIRNEQKVSVSPVPADGSILINSLTPDYSSARRIYILNETGQQVFDHKFSTKDIHIQTSSYPNGYYIVNVVDQGVTNSTKIMIVHH